MMTKRQRFEWLLFALTATIFCLVLAFRPIPTIDSDNDTGRYMHMLHLYCAGSVGEKIANRAISFAMFNAITSPACLFKSDGFFLFEVAAFLPLMFLLFAKWRKGTFFWACSLMFSVFGLELMTNAMRQSFAMLIFFGAIALFQRNRFMALLLGLIAVVAHTSTVAFFPFLLWIIGVRLSKKEKLMGMVGLLSLGIVISLAFYASIIESIQSLNEWGMFFGEMYSEELTPPFILFMTLPLYWVYGVRYFFVRNNISSDERKGVVYSTGLLLICFFLFPSITYRFAICAVALQIFLVTHSETPDLKAGRYALIGLLVHLFVMLAVSNHFAVLIHG
ncbi:MAG: EpsG family protein [Pseudomonadota bacterium]